MSTQIALTRQCSGKLESGRGVEIDACSSNGSAMSQCEGVNPR